MECTIQDMGHLYRILHNRYNNNTVHTIIPPVFAVSKLISQCFAFNRSILTRFIYVVVLTPHDIYKLGHWTIGDGAIASLYKCPSTRGRCRSREFLWVKNGKTSKNCHEPARQSMQNDTIGTESV